MKTALKVVGLLVLAVVLIVGTVFIWASVTADRTLARTIDSHSVDFPVPFPLEEAEVEELGLSPAEAEALALERALERGRHLVEARYACAECHGVDYGGGVMVDAFPIGTLLGPNLTSGEGSAVRDYTVADWDRIVRHGILPDGRPAVMPSEDFLLMSDQELSDIIAFLAAQPPVDNEVGAVRLGPLGRFLVARREIVLSADHIEDHFADHPSYPPAAEVTVEFGRHLAGVCIGCHRPDMAGGRIAGGDPSWVPAANLTPHEEGLAGWSYENFAEAMLEERRPDGSEIREPMSFVTPFARNMTQVELEAIWMYLQSLPPRPTN
jgi:mono/diheme cytochrome c family protein